MTRVRLAVAGAGAIGRAHIERIGASGQCQIVAIAATPAVHTARVPPDLPFALHRKPHLT